MEVSSNNVSNFEYEGIEFIISDKSPDQLTAFLITFR